jgi:hypothetical protein
MDNEAPALAEKQSAKINKHGGKRANRDTERCFPYLTRC